MLCKYSWLAIAGALVAGCDSQGPGNPQPIQQRLTLENFTSCGELQGYIEDVAVRQMRTQLDSYKSSGWVAFGGGVDDAAPGVSGAKDAGSGGPAAYTTTNVQVAGVDEADFMKNDGTRIFVLAGHTLYSSTSWPPVDLSLAGSLDFKDSYPSQMFLDDKNRLVVFSYVYTRYPWFAADAGGGAPGRGLACAAWECGYYYANTTKVSVVDVSDPANMKVTAEYLLPGSYSDSRRIGASVRLVQSDYFRWPAGVKWWPQATDPSIYNDPVRYRAWLDRALEQLKVDNEAVIRAETLDHWLPPGQRIVDGKLVDLKYNCTDFSRANAPVRLGLLTIATINLDSGTLSRSSILAETGQVYASTRSLYVATPHWWWWPALGQRDYTYVHKFDLTDPQRANYVASGGITGHIVDQFSMDEDKGYFRIATNVMTRVPDPNNPRNLWGIFHNTNRVSVMAERSGVLRVIGETGELSPGEAIRSSRFVGDKGFVVTARQVDPLFTLDLSDPTAPKQVGELKVPGFSSYIHPIDANTLLTMGVYMPEPDQNGHVNWQERRMKLSMYDVTDFKNPQVKQDFLVGTAYGWSDAAWEHKAFNYFPERGLLAIPFSDYQPAADPDHYWTSFVSDLKVFKIDGACTDHASCIQARGSLGMKDIYQKFSDYGWTWYWSPWIRRSVMASDDQKNDFVYAVSDSGIRVANLKDLATPLSTVLFPKAR